MLRRLPLLAAFVLLAAVAAAVGFHLLGSASPERRVGLILGCKHGAKDAGAADPDAG